MASEQGHERPQLLSRKEQLPRRLQDRVDEVIHPGDRHRARDAGYPNTAADKGFAVVSALVVCGPDDDLDGGIVRSR
jgi:hypothetical protein